MEAKIKITGCGGEQYWYKDKIGSEFTAVAVVDESKNPLTGVLKKESFVLKDDIDEDKICAVDVVDCEVVSGDVKGLRRFVTPHEFMFAMMIGDFRI